jgi:hypothetical protein
MPIILTSHILIVVFYCTEATELGEPKVSRDEKAMVGFVLNNTEASR